MGDVLDVGQADQQEWLGVIQGLDLRFLVNAPVCVVWRWVGYPWAVINVRGLQVAASGKGLPALAAHQIIIGKGSSTAAAGQIGRSCAHGLACWMSALVVLSVAYLQTWPGDGGACLWFRDLWTAQCGRRHAESD
ncbi:MAG: hypothetical protein WAM11_06470 [Cyanobium sp.]